MQIVFKITTSPTPSNPIVADTNFGQHYAGVNASFAWSELSPGIRQATQLYILPYIGLQMYLSLASKYNNAVVMTDEETQALEYLQDAAANYAVYHLLPQKASSLATLGNVQQSPEGGAQPSPQWTLNMKRDDALMVADKALDMLLQYMEFQIQEGSNDFDLWKNDPAYKTKTSVFFRHTSEMEEYLNIKGSRRTYVSIIPFFAQVERRIIKAALCGPLYEALQTYPLTIENELLLPLIKEAVAYLGAADALPHHRVVIDGDGFRVVSQTDGYTDRRNLTNNVHESAVQALLATYQERGAEALRELKYFLEENIEDYPLYASSNCRQNPANTAHTIVQSPSGIGVVGFF